VIRARHAVWAIAMMPACFHPSYEHPACGPDQQCPPGLHCNDQLICDPDGVGNVVDAAAGAPDDARLGGPGEDAAVDAVVPVTGCYVHWFAGDLAIATPVAVPAGDPFADSRDPWVSRDGLRLYLSRGFNDTSHDIYLATRVATSMPFGTAAKVDNLSMSEDDTRPALTADEQLIVLARNSNGAAFDIFMAVRPTTMQEFAAPDDRHLINVNAGGGDHYDPFLSGDGRRLYLSPATDRGQKILVASRPDLDADFGTPIPVGLPGNANLDADPAVSPDERVIVFTSDRANGPGGTDLWYATRPDTQHPFGAPILVPVVNGLKNEGDPMLTADGCELYFASNQDRPNYQIFSAAISP
jgi:hypothetical protein